MKALRIHAPGDPASISYDEVPRPQPGAGEVLVKVFASGISPKEIYWATSTGQLKPLPATLGFELSGVVVALGDDVHGLSAGTEVFGMPSFKEGGTQAEYLTVRAAELAPKPPTISHIEASAVPLSALTAWQALFDQAGLAPGQSVLIHGAAGGVGVYAVQLAHWRNARIIASTTGQNETFLSELGADEVIDYNAVQFEDAVREVDVVLDLVGGETLRRSWSVLKKGGILVSIANVTQEELNTSAEQWGVRAVWFLVKPDREQLVSIAEMIDAGKIKPQIAAIFPLAEGRQAYQMGLKGHNRGKIVLEIARENEV